ncbi:mechanosensitive ion channel family protein [Gramella lutea]|uniref:Mechanosensitive ion channel family protein n=1 Tax=Christiangramia lutea TaxID=1607951 RepID=A0A9X1V2P8_9FLAO|nr:mechanosensitive ion channel family protein [Christiangramia lutea]MCH4823185.1 mechanosensitive ion channel family protein [Christiangramia lutea]
MEPKIAAVYAVLVVIFIIILLLFIRFIHRMLVKRAREKNPESEFHSLNIINRIVNTLTLIFGIFLLSFIFFDESHYKEIGENFRKIFYIGIVSIFSIVFASIVESFFSRMIKRRVSSGEDPTSYKFLRYLSVVTVYFIGLILIALAFPSLRSIAHTAIGGAGVAAIIIGVASQEALSNIVGGVFIIAFRPFKIGDIIRISEELVGTVHDITLRHTVIRNYENKMIVIPNSIINKEKVTNYDLEEKRVCQWIEIGISYDSDIDLAKKIMKEECETHPNIIDVRSNLEIRNNVPKVIVRVIELGNSAVTLRAWAWAWDFSSAFVMKCDLYENIKKRFDREGIEIPFPHRTLVFKDSKVKTEIL